MPTDYNYGPRMNIGEVRQARAHSTIIPSEYLDIDGFGLTTSESIGSQQSHLGSHWKKISSSSQAPSIRSVCPSTPRTTSSLMSHTTESSDVCSMTSRTFTGGDGTSSWTDNSGSSESSLSSSTMHANPAVSVSQLSDSLGLSTEVREEGHCLQLQMAGLVELQPVIEDFTDQLAALHAQQTDTFFNITHDSQEKFDKLEKSIEYVEESVDDTVNNYEKSAEDFADLVNETRGALYKKETVEQFIRKNESFHLESSRVVNKMEDSLKILATIRQNLKSNKPEAAPLTVFGQEDSRLKAVFDGLVEMVSKLPLGEYERRDFDFAIKKTQRDSTFENRAKCELIIRHLVTVMHQWENQNKSSSSCFDTSDWNSIGSISSTSDVLKEHNYIGSSSFALTDDSNLNDLEESLRSAAIRVAVEGPNQVYECSPWNPSSLSGDFDTSGRTSIKSLHTPMTLSSYVLTSSVGESTCSSLSRTSMPTFEEASQSLIRSASGSSMKPLSVKTAFSQSDPISNRTPRSFEEKSLVQSATGAPTTMENPPSLNFSTLSEIAEDALHTAKEGAESPAANLLEALHNSARKCGVVVSELMTAVSTSSESLSDTQSSHPSITH